MDRLFLAVQYVLLPSTRTWWDAQPLDGCFAAARDLARTVVALRDGDAPDLSRLPAPEVIRAFLPSTWLAELAAASGSPAELVAAAGTDPLGAPGAPVHIQLLGPVALLRDGTPVTSPHLRRGRVRELLAYLVVHRGATRQSIAADLWPDLGEAAAARNLRVTLTYLAQLLDEPDRPRTEPLRLVRRTGNRIELIESPLLTTDVWTVDRLLAEAAHAEQQRAPSVALARYQETVRTYTGMLLADESGAEWLLPHRDRLRRRFVAAAVRAGELLLASGAADEPLRLAQRAVTADRWSEPAHQLLVSANLAAGNSTAAHLALDDCHRMLRALGAPPDARTLMLTRRLAGGGPHRLALPTDRLTSVPAPPNRPAQRR